MIDQRLIGSWKSDNRRTMRDFRKLKRMPEKSIKVLGKKIYIRFDGPGYYWIPVEMRPGLTREWFRRVGAHRRSRKK